MLEGLGYASMIKQSIGVKKTRRFLIEVFPEADAYSLVKGVPGTVIALLC